MPKNFFRGLAILFLVIFITGCGVKARRYVQVRERADLQASGNAGYLTGSPSSSEVGPVKKTRKVYVVEFTRDGGQEEIEDIDIPPPPRRSSPTRSSRRERVRQPAPVVESTVTYTEYKVKKGDTLQKISKQFYGGYSKWPRIQKANESILKDPNQIKPGMVIRIPMEE